VGKIILQAREASLEASPPWSTSSMRICHVIESSSGGSGQVVVDLLRYGVAVGDQMTLIYSPVRAEPPFTDSISALSEVVRIRALPMQRKVGWGDVSAAWRLLRLLRELGPFDIIHSHSSKAGALTRLVGLFLPSAARVYTPHAFVTMAPQPRIVYGVVEWLASWFCDAIIVGSEQELQHARTRLHISPSRLRLIPPGIDLNYVADRATARETLQAREGDYVVGFVGRLAAQKNLMRLAEAFAYVAAQRPDAKLAVVGDGPLREDLERELERLGLTGRFLVLTGYNARDLMPGFDCLVCTSDYESFGLIFPEALAAGVPLVTPPVGIAEEAVIENRTGHLTSFDPREIAGGVLKLAALDDHARLEMSAECRLHARKFDVMEMARQTHALYESLVPDAS
jgi:glycosyltransferase involved in cell wall biosynthesis